MPSPKDLPGFYYDPEKNRYFPIKGPIPGTKRRLPPSSSSSSRDAPPGQNHEVHITGCRKRIKASELLHAREMHGGVIFSNKSKSSFRQQYQYVQASQPVVWKYQETTLVADGALEQLYGIVQTPNGLRESKILATGSMNGTVRLYGIENALENFDNEIECLPKPAWSPLGKHKAVENSALASIWSSAAAFSNFSSSATCIKRLDHRFPHTATANSSVQRALVATLGSGESGGSIFVMNLSDPMDLIVGSSNIYRRNIRIASFDRTVWTADCNSDGTQAVVGTNSGAALLNLETRALSWLYRSKSDILSQQFVQSGNVVLCGLRNGSIVPVDLRQKHPNISSGLTSPSTARRTVPMPPARHNEKWITQADKAKSLRVASMSSAVCSLVAFSSDEHYFLGGSMDGSIKLFDLRLIQKGAVQSYEGHVNSHTHLPLAVDPSETLVMSGGEDCTVRIWSIKTGELIFAQNVADTIFTTICWPQSSTDLHGSDKTSGTFPHCFPYTENRFDLNHSWGVWMGSRDGLFYMHGT